jgi:hypothetical protein
MLWRLVSIRLSAELILSLRRPEPVEGSKGSKPALRQAQDIARRSLSLNNQRTPVFPARGATAAPEKHRKPVPLACGAPKIGFLIYPL